MSQELHKSTSDQAITETSKRCQKRDKRDNMSVGLNERVPQPQ